MCWQVKDEEKYSINSIYPREKSGLMYDCKRKEKLLFQIVKYTGLKVFFLKHVYSTQQKII